MNALRQWFDGLAPRERIAVAAAGVMLAVAMFYFLIWLPLGTGVSDGRMRLERQAEETRYMLGLRDEAEQLRASGTPSQLQGLDDSLLSIVDSTSRENGLGEAVRRIQPDDEDQATVTLENAGFNQLLFWLRTLETDYGIIPRQMTINRNEQAGTVQARLTLARVAS